MNIKHNEYKCPFCAEEVKMEAKICKHCGRDITPVYAGESQTSSSTSGIPLTDANNKLGIFTAVGAVLGAIGMVLWNGTNGWPIAAAIGVILGAVAGYIFGFIDSKT